MSAAIHSLADARRRREAATGHEPWLSKKDLAVHLGCSTRHIEALATQGRDAGLPLPSILVGNMRRYRASEVEAWLRCRGEGAA